MKIAKRSAPGNDDFKPGASTGITAENYVDRARAFIAGRGGEGFVIRAIEGAKGSMATRDPPTDAAWVSWMLWFADKKIPTQFMKSHGMATVPTEFPDSFDAECPVADRLARITPPPMSDDSRRYLIERGLRDLSRNLALMPKRQGGFEVADLKPVLAEDAIDAFARRSHSTSCAPLGSYAQKKPEEAA